jgi:hypothetical protein
MAVGTDYCRGQCDTPWSPNSVLTTVGHLSSLIPSPAPIIPGEFPTIEVPICVDARPRPDRCRSGVGDGPGAGECRRGPGPDPSTEPRKTPTPSSGGCSLNSRPPSQEALLRLWCSKPGHRTRIRFRQLPTGLHRANPHSRARACSRLHIRSMCTASHRLAQVWAGFQPLALPSAVNLNTSRPAQWKVIAQPRVELDFRAKTEAGPRRTMVLW